MPTWVARISYGERFGIEPHKVNPPLRWWHRLSEIDRFRAAKDAREYVDKHTKAKSAPEIQALYDWLVKQARNG